MKVHCERFISFSAIIALTGYIMSGPVAYLIVHLVHPQPEWVSPAVFAKNYNIIQDLPFYFGFMLIGGMLMLVTAHYLNYTAGNELRKFLLLLAVGCTIVFCALITFNYICQTTFIRNLALFYKPEYDAAISTFSMSNPMSFCWANEMWGYAIMGIATWLVAGYYQDRSNFIRILLIANGVVSLLSALWTVIDVNWVMTTAGIVAYFVWNVLMIVIMVSIYMNSKRSEQYVER
jgi:hypothetical protein